MWEVPLSSRWYPGAGLYRNVHVIQTEDVHVPVWGTQVITPHVEQAYATVKLLTTMEQVGDAEVRVRTRILSPSGREVAVKDNTQSMLQRTVFEQNLTVDQPELWSPESPSLYQAVSEIYVDGVKKDTYTTRFGIRSIEYVPDKGFFLNGQLRKFQGVCNHHDLGPLGAAVNVAALRRQLTLLKDMGCDAIRTAHNMPSTWQMEVCDSMGMMVMAESFDMWIYPKCKNGYSRFFKDWAIKDITNLVLNHRNHPCIVMWSIGNEIPEQWDKDTGVYWARTLQETIHQLDPTRPVTQGMDHAEDALRSGFAQVMDIPGFNYHVDKYDENMKLLSTGFLLGSETASTVSSRGVYKFPVELSDYSQYASYSPNYDPVVAKTGDGQCSSYDVQWCPWSNLPDDDFMVIDDYSYTIGQFVWTGFDYLGEPTPYDEYWPARSSYFGICDLAGLPKDRYYLYRSQWNKHAHTLHILPHWTWPGREGQITPVYVYTDYPEAELFINGKSQGRVKKNTAAHTLIAPINYQTVSTDGKQPAINDSLLDRYRLRWNKVVYEPGEVKVVAYDTTGNIAQEQIVKTAGEPKDLQLTLEPVEGDLAFVHVAMTDEHGTIVPTTQDNLTFQVAGNGSFQAACNGDATSLEVFTEPHMHLFNGEMVVIVKLNDSPATATLIVNCPERGLSKNIIIPARASH